MISSIFSFFFILLFIYFPSCLSVCLSASLFAWVFVYPSVCLPVFFVCLSVCVHEFMRVSPTARRQTSSAPVQTRRIWYRMEALQTTEQSPWQARGRRQPPHHVTSSLLQISSPSSQRPLPANPSGDVRPLPAPLPCHKRRELVLSRLSRSCLFYLANCSRQLAVLVL